MGALLDAVPAGGADHTEHHRDLATAIEAAATTAAVAAGYQPLDSDLTAIAALSTTAYGRSLLTLANQAALQAEAGGGGGSLTPGVDYPTSATVTLSSADILDLHNTPVTLVAAPGAGKFLILHRIIEVYDHGTVSYATDDGNPAVAYAGGEVAGVLELPSLTQSYFWPIAPHNNGLGTGIENDGLVVSAYGSVFTDGDGTLTVTVWYSIEDVP